MILLIMHEAKSLSRQLCSYIFNNFIMSAKKPLGDCFSISFSNNNRGKQNEEIVQRLKDHALKKREIFKKIWKMTQQQVCEIFLNYQIFPQSLFTLKDLQKSERLILTKKDTTIYFGEYERSKKVGKGICIYEDGKIYEGQFSDNLRSGLGIEINQNGNVYLGKFRNDMRHGKGQYFWFSFDKSKEKGQEITQFFDGEWWGGVPDGEGIHQKKNGDLYFGNFRNGHKYGIGKCQFGNGDRYKGQYLNGLPEGLGEYTWKDGSYYKGSFKQGLRNGNGKWMTDPVREDCERYQGSYSLDKKSGYGVYTWESGWEYRGNFESDNRSGYGELFYGNQCFYKGFWIDGKQADQLKQIGRIVTRKSISLQKSRLKNLRNQTINPESFENPELSLTNKKSSKFSSKLQCEQTPRTVFQKIAKQSPSKSHNSANKNLRCYSSKGSNRYSSSRKNNNYSTIGIQSGPEEM